MDKDWKLIAFDCDGVLVDSLPQVKQLMDAHCEAKGLTWNQVDMFRSDPIHYIRERDYCVNEFMVGFETLYRNAQIHHAVFDIVKRLWVQREQTHVVVITANETHIVRNRLESADMARFFHDIYGDQSIDFSGRSFPGALKSQKAKQLDVVMNRIGARPEQCCLIGDSTSDMHSAREAGAVGIGAAWGFQAYEDLADVANVVAREPTELAGFLGI